MIAPDEESASNAKRQQSAEEASTSDGHQAKRRRGGLKRQSTLVAQTGEVYVPPKADWPLDIVSLTLFDQGTYL